MGYGRIWEIDVLRAIAIILMLVFHGVYDLNEFLGMEINYMSGFWYWVGKVSALLFIFLSGISSGLGRGIVKRGVKVVGWGMGITVVTYLFLGDQYVRFGILHLLGVSMILFPVLKRINIWFLLVLAGGTAYAAIPFKQIVVNTNLLLPFGITYRGFATVDYYPLIPYLSMFILGVLAYKVYYYKRKSLFSPIRYNKVILGISKSSLGIYLIHQPIMVGIILLLKFLHLF